MTEETHPEAADILREAGWAPHDAWQVYTRDTLVMGFQPDRLAFHVKNWAKVQPGDRAYSEDTPDTPEEAASWLVALFNVNPLSTEATLEPVAVLSEAEETAAHESDSETGEEADGDGATAPGVVYEGGDSGGLEQVDLGYSDTGRSGSGVVAFAADGDEAGGDAEEENFDVSNGESIGGELAHGSGGDVSDADFEAIFEEAPDLGAELLDDEAFAHGELPAPDPLDFAPDEIEPEPEHSPGAFIFGDNLAHDRIIRIGQLSEHATDLIAAAKSGYSDNEHDAVRSHVVTNMNEAGAYVGGRQDLFDRFIELETVTGLIRRIEIYRDERQDFIRSADRDAVAAFEPAAGWP
tara:strand:- start:5922 stop:6974 length:1053 start_codon:yes stop_codon:yes gene_type:complete